MKQTFSNLYERIFKPVHHLPVGMYQMQSQLENNTPYRLHLRINPDGSGVLILNASTVLHLNATAAEFAYYMVRQTPLVEVLDEVARRYNISSAQARQDYLDLTGQIDALIKTPDLDPDIFLDFERRDPYSVKLSAPNRLDCAVTYHTSEKSHSNDAPLERVKREMSTEEWKTILSKAWDAGIPHIIFTGGEPTLRPDLPELISHCEGLGQITGVLTDGFRLTDTKYLHDLLQSGLDHVMLLLDPGEDQSWEAIRDVIAEDIYATIHITITDKNAPKMQSLLDRLNQMEVKAISLSAEDKSLKQALKTASDYAAHLGMKLTWDLPVPYSEFNSFSHEEDEIGAATSGAGKAWLYVEPDGDVLPGQGINKVLGNLLENDWLTIWERLQ